MTPPASGDEGRRGRAGRRRHGMFALVSLTMAAAGCSSPAGHGAQPRRDSSAGRARSRQVLVQRVTDRIKDRLDRESASANATYACQHIDRELRSAITAAVQEGNLSTVIRLTGAGQPGPLGPTAGATWELVQWAAGNASDASARFSRLDDAVEAFPSSTDVVEPGESLAPVAEAFNRIISACNALAG